MSSDSSSTSSDPIATPSKRQKILRRRNKKLQRLQLSIMKWAFEKTGKKFRSEYINKLDNGFQEEIAQIYNNLCPGCHLRNLIREERHSIKDSIPLCITTCINCPKKSILNSKKWILIEHEDFKRVIQDLNNFIGVKDDAEVITLNWDIKINQHRITLNNRWLIKVLKKSYFKKTRFNSEKHKPAQPLNLTAGCFWVELLKDKIYLIIEDHGARRESSETPINSVIGATVDSSMQICLSLQSSSESNKNEEDNLYQVSFKLYIKREYLRTNDPFIIEIAICKNDDQSSHALRCTEKDKEANTLNFSQFDIFSFGVSHALFHYIKPLGYSYIVTDPKTGAVTVSPPNGCCKSTQLNSGKFIVGQNQNASSEENKDEKKENPYQTRIYGESTSMFAYHDIPNAAQFSSHNKDRSDANMNTSSGETRHKNNVNLYQATQHGQSTTIFDHHDDPNAAQLSLHTRGQSNAKIIYQNDAIKQSLDSKGISNLFSDQTIQSAEANVSSSIQKMQQYYIDKRKNRPSRG